VHPEFALHFCFFDCSFIAQEVSVVQMHCSSNVNGMGSVCACVCVRARACVRGRAIGIKQEQ